MYAARTWYVLFYLHTDVSVGLLKNTNGSDERRGNVAIFSQYNYENPRARVYSPGPFLYSRPRDYFGAKYHTPYNIIYVRICVRINNGDLSQGCFTKTDTLTCTFVYSTRIIITSVCPRGQNMYRVPYDWVCYKSTNDYSPLQKDNRPL